MTRTCVTHGETKSSLSLLANQFEFDAMIRMNAFVLGIHVDVGSTLAIIKGSTHHQVFVTIAIEIHCSQTVSKTAKRNSCRQ